MAWLIAGVVLVGVAAIAYGLHRTALWAERRGWIYYRAKDRPRPTPIGILDAIYQPEIEHVAIEASEEAIRADEAQSGRDPGIDEDT